MPEIRIPIATVKDDFKSFLNIDNNSKIFFSGKFGIGKTHFLSEFFGSSLNYEVFHLFPVKYQISSNEDIIEFIKYDLLIELINKYPEILKKNNVQGITEQALLFYSWYKNRNSVNSVLGGILNATSMISELPIDPTLGVLAKIGRPLKTLLDIDTEFQNFKKAYKAGERGKVDKYLDLIREKDISEVDYLSHLLKAKISEINKNKKSILIIDDLDRIDPEHVFRILNILSAHLEGEECNKFGFSQIIIVADYSNLESIYRHKYGSTVDFPGYVDKFFSVKPYYFDNKKSILDTVDEIARSIKNGDTNLADAVGEKGNIYYFLRYIFYKAIDADSMNLRELLRPCKHQLLGFKNRPTVLRLNKNGHYTFFKIAVEAAVGCFSSSKDFLNCVNKFKDVKSPNYAEDRTPYDYFIGIMLEELHIMPFHAGGEDFRWGVYSFKFRIGQCEMRNGDKEHLFIDLLCKYVGESKYKEFSL